MADEIRKDGSVIRDILAQSEIDFIEGGERINICRTTYGIDIGSHLS